eukprot:Skav234070  [mRNA]  locus=scaffold2565:36267:38300:+ [translate_table: standard]
MVWSQGTGPRPCSHPGLRLEESLQSRLQTCKEKRSWQKALSLIGWSGSARVELRQQDFKCAGTACLQRNWMFALCLMRQYIDTAFINIGIAASSKAGRWSLGLTLLSTMQNLDLQADIISYNSAASSVKWDHALWLTSSKGRRGSIGHDMDAVGLNAVLTAGSMAWCQVLWLLNQAPSMRLKVNIRCLTAALSVFERANLWHRAMHSMVSSRQTQNGIGDRIGIMPDKKSMSTLMSACGKGNQWKVAMHIFLEMPQGSISPDAIVFSVVINACKDDGWGAALGIFNDLTRSTKRRLFLSTPDIASAYQMTMSICRLRWQLPLCLLGTMSAARVHKSGNLGDEACFNAAVSACDAGNMWRKAVEVSLVRHCNLIGTNSAISACGASRWEVALKLQDLQVHRSLQDEVSFNSVLTACADATEWSSGMMLLRKMVSCMVQPSEFSQNLVLSVDKFSWPLALEGFCGIRTCRMAQSRISCNAAVTCCEKSSMWSFAVHLLHSLRRSPTKQESLTSLTSPSSLSPDIITISAAISACEKGGQWSMALTLLSADFVFDRNEISFNAAISATEKTRQWERSQSLLDKILQTSLRPTEITYNAVISACHKALEPV